MKILSKFKEMSLIKKILCIVLIVIVVGTVAGGSSNDESKQVTKKKDNETKEVHQEKKKNGIGDIVTVDDVDYLVNNVEVSKQIGSEYANTTANDTYLIIDISITNNKKESLSISDSFFKLLNGENEYSTDTTGAVYLSDSSIIFKELNPEVTLQGKIVFDVPEAITTDNETLLQVKTGVWDSKKDTISLAR